MKSLSFNVGGATALQINRTWEMTTCLYHYSQFTHIHIIIRLRLLRHWLQSSRNQAGIYCCHSSGWDPWPLTFLVVFSPGGLSGVHGPPQVLPLQVGHTRCLRLLDEKHSILISMWNTQVIRRSFQVVRECVRPLESSSALNSLITVSNSWSCRCIKVFHCSKSSGSVFWMSFRVPSVWMVPSFMAIIWK